MSEKMPATVLARLIADALEDNDHAIEVTEGPHGISDVRITRSGMDEIYNLIVKSLRQGGIAE